MFESKTYLRDQLLFQLRLLAIESMFFLFPPQMNLQIAQASVLLDEYRTEIYRRPDFKKVYLELSNDFPILIWLRAFKNDKELLKECYQYLVLIVTSSINDREYEIPILEASQDDRMFRMLTQQPHWSQLVHNISQETQTFVVLRYDVITARGPLWRIWLAKNAL